MPPCVHRSACRRGSVGLRVAVRLRAACLARGGGWLLLGCSSFSSLYWWLRDLVADRGGPVVSR
uniref:Uncharacterized protein n=1 Tax=Fagus sylvatica TaxID=28930 RepID=A0A2N9J4J6_FAGSY